MEQKTKTETTFFVRPYMKRQLIQELNLSSEKEFDAIVKPHKEELGKRMGYHYTIPQVKLIFQLVQQYRATR